MNQQARISLLQLVILYISTSFGAGILSLPRDVGEIAREDMWISVLLGGLAMVFSLWCAISLGNRFPELMAIEYQRILLGPVLGQICNVFFLLSLLLVGAAGLRSFAAATKFFLFDLTPIYIIMFIFLAVAAYAGQHDLGPLIRVQQFLAILISPIYVLLFMLGLLKVDVRHLQPILAGGIIPVLKGVQPSFLAYSGPELITGLLFPFVTQKKRAFKAAVLSTAVLVIMYTLITVIVLGILGADTLIRMILPTIMAYREVEVPDTFIERIDGYLFLLHLALYTMSLANILYFLSFACSRLMKLEYSRPIGILLLPVIYFITLLPQSVEQVELFYNVISIVSVFWGLLVLPFLLFVAKLRNLGGKKNCDVSG